MQLSGARIRRIPGSYSYRHIDLFAHIDCIQSRKLGRSKWSSKNRGQVVERWVDFL